MPNEIGYYEHLAEIMYKTRGCRFAAASALEIKERWSVGTVAFLSAYLVSWSVILVSYPEVFNSKHAAFYTAISAIASISLLVISLMDYAFGRSVQAEKVHQNALSIPICMRELERELASKSPDVAAMQKIAIVHVRIPSDGNNYSNHLVHLSLRHTEFILAIGSVDNLKRFKAVTVSTAMFFFGKRACWIKKFISSL